MKSNTTPKSRRGLWLSLTTLGLVGALVALPLQSAKQAVVTNDDLAQVTRSHKAGFENYDIRTDAKAIDTLLQFRAASGRNSAAVETTREDFITGEQNLRTRIPTLKVEYNEDIKIPEVIAPDIHKGFNTLTGASSTKRSEILRNFAKENNELIGMTDGQLEQLKVLADYTNPDGVLSYAHLEQLINGVPVFRGEIKAGFTKNGEMIRVINNLAPGMDYEGISTDFRNPADAVQAAFRHVTREMKAEDTVANAAESTDNKVKFGTGDWATTAEKMYFPTEPGVARPAWRVLIWEPVAAFYVIVDAENGTMLWRKNITEDQTQSATYNVYANSNAMINSADSPAPLTPGLVNPTLGTQGTIIARTNVTRIGNEAPYTFNNNGWITDGANTTDGNSNEAGIDRDGVNGVDAPQTGSPNRVFTTTAPAWNPPPGNPAPGDDPLTPQAQRGAVIQMFYAMNLYHDEMYRLGFTEQAFNFQADNFGRGGAGADRVSSEGQDSSGTNNANFSTPADGGRGRMQMYVWTGPTPDYDGTTDVDVVIHEVTHGTSNRLHGNAAGLSTNMARGMGEGWSDFYGHAMLSEPTDPANGIYTTGGYATYLIAPGFNANYYYGIRRFPKAVIAFTGPNGRPHNPLTFRHINSNCNTEIGTPTTIGTISAYPRGPIGVTQCDQVHNIGEVWSSALWEVRAKYIARLGWAVGNRRVLQHVTDGMKLAPLGPTLLQERDAILTAAAVTSSADRADVWAGFALRGMGFGAQVIAQSPANVVESFDLPNAVLAAGFAVADPAPGGNNNGFPEPGETVRLTVPVVNNTGNPVTGVSVRVNGGTPVSYGTINDGQTVSNNINVLIPANAPCGSTYTFNIEITTGLGVQNATRSVTLGAPQVSLTQSFDGVTAPALPAGWTQVATGSNTGWVTSATTPDSPPNSAFAPNPNTAGGADLDSTTVNITSASAVLRFRNNYNTENTWDGGVVEVKIGAAGTFQDIIAAGGTVLEGGYNGTCRGTGNPLLNRACWTGNSNGYINTAIQLPASANGQPVTFRFRIGHDSSVAGVSWQVDTITVIGGYTCGPIGSGAHFDYDGDGKSDISVFRPGASANWYLNRSTAGFQGVAFGTTGDAIAPADFDGDGKTDVSVFRSSNGGWYRINSSTNTFVATNFGTAGDLARPGDFDGDGKADISVFRPSNGGWYRTNSGNSQFVAITFGQTGDIPLIGDFDGDGKDDIAVFRGSNGGWYRINSGNSQFVATTFGTSGDVPAVGDFDGDGKDDISVFRGSNGTWYRTNSGNSQFVAVGFGTSGDVPAVGDFDGDGKADISVFRPSNGGWYRINSGNSSTTSTAFGQNGDVPTPSAFQ